jgi:hypothetical protein
MCFIALSPVHSHYINDHAQFHFGSVSRFLVIARYFKLVRNSSSNILHLSASSKRSTGVAASNISSLAPGMSPILQVLLPRSIRLLSDHRDEVFATQQFGQFLCVPVRYIGLIAHSKRQWFYHTKVFEFHLQWLCLSGRYRDSATEELSKEIDDLALRMARFVVNHETG